MTTEGIDLPSAWPGDPRGAMARSFWLMTEGHRRRGRGPSRLRTRLSRPVGDRVDQPFRRRRRLASARRPVDRARRVARRSRRGRARPRAARPRRCSGIRCSGRCCPTAPRAPWPRRRPGRRASSASVDITNPGVQNPHWKAKLSMNACCSGCRVSPSARPSMVMTSAPSACTASMRHERTRLAVHEHRARAAHAVLAPEVGAGELELLAEEVGERRPDFGGRRPRRAVDGELDRLVDHRCALSAAVVSVRRTVTAARCVRYAADPCTSVPGSRSAIAVCAAAAQRLGRRLGTDELRFGGRAHGAARRRHPSRRCDCRRCGRRRRARAWRRRRRGRSRRGGAADLLERAPGRRIRGRHPHLDDALVVVERGGEVALEEVGGRDHALAARAPQRRLEPSSTASTHGISADGVGVGDRAADGATGADGGVTDERQRLGEQRHPVATIGDRSAPLADQGAEREPSAVASIPDSPSTR